MGGPSTTRTPNSQTAPQPSLTGPSLGLLQGIFGGGNVGGNVQQRFGNPLQQQVGNNYSQLLGGQGNPLGGQGGGGASTLGGQVGGALSSQFLGQNPGQNVLNAYEPLFQRNLQQIQGSGPRFSSGNDQLRARSLQDFNAFAGNTLMQGQQQQLQAALGAGGLLGQAGGFAGQQMPLLQQLLGSLFQGGGINTPAVLNQQPGFGQQIGGLLGTGLGFALGGPLGGALGGSVGGGLFGGGGGQGTGSFGPGFQGLFGSGTDTPPLPFSGV